MSRVGILVVVGCCALASGGAAADAASSSHSKKTSAKAKKVCRKSKKTHKRVCFTKKATKKKTAAKKPATATPVPAPAQSSPDTAGVTVSITGTGGFNIAGGFIGHFQLHDVKSGLHGENPSGTVSTQSTFGPGIPFLVADGKVTCIASQGTKATIKYEFDNSSVAAFKGGGIQIFVQDNGPGDQDKIGFLPPQDPVTWKATSPSKCDGAPNPFALDSNLMPFNNAEGNITITRDGSGSQTEPSADDGNQPTEGGGVISGK